VCLIFLDAYVPFRVEVVDLHTLLRSLLSGSPHTLSDIVVLRGDHPAFAAYTFLLTLEAVKVFDGAVLDEDETEILSFAIITAAVPFAHPFPGVSPTFPGEIVRQVRWPYSVPFDPCMGWIELYSPLVSFAQSCWFDGKHGSD
jgi:hypothetical protein